MDIYLKSHSTGEEVVIPILPEKISFRTKAETISYRILRKGEIAIPDGRAPEVVSWSSFFPHKRERGAKYIGWFSDQKKMVEILRRWLQTEERLRLLITETAIHFDVFVSSFSGEYQGGGPRFYYDIELREVRQVRVVTTKAMDEAKASTRPGTPPAKKSHTVVKGDCLWNISKQYYGDGAQWRKIYDANKSKIKNPDLIFPGQVFTIP